MSTLLTPLKRPSATAPHQALKKDGNTSVSKLTTRPWTSLAREIGKTQTSLKLALLFSSQQSQPSQQDCSTTKGSLLIRHTFLSTKDAHASTQLRQQSQTCVSTSLTPLKKPSGTAPHHALKKDGSISVSKLTTRPWTPLAREIGKTQTSLKLALLFSSQQSQPSQQDCLTTKGSLLIRHSLHSGRPGTMPNGWLAA